MSGRSSIGVGLALLGVGLAALLGRLGLFHLSEVWRGWPLILVGLGTLLWWERGRANASGFGTPERFLAIAITAVGFAVSFGFVVPGPEAHRFERPPPPPQIPEIELTTRSTRELACAGGLPLELALVAVTVEIRGSHDDGCRVAIATPADDAAAPAIEVTEGAEALRIAVDNASERLVRLTLEVPHGIGLRGVLDRTELDAEGVGPVALETVGSSLRLDGVADLVAQISAGSVSARNISGPVEIDARNSDVTLAEIAGPVTIRGMFSRIRVTSSASPIEVTANAGRVAIAKAATIVVVRSEGTAIDISGSSARVEVEASDANVHLDAVQGGAIVAMRGGWLSASDIQGDLTLSSAPRRATLSRIAGSIHVRVQNTRTSLQSCVGSVDLEQDGGSVRVSRHHGHARLATRDCELELDLDEGGSIDVVSERGNIFLRLASEHLGANVNTVRGAIRFEPDSTLGQAAEAAPTDELRIPGNPMVANIAATDGIVRVRR